MLWIFLYENSSFGIISSVQFSDNSLSGNIGLALSQSMILSGMLPHGVRQMGEYISQTTSVERVLQYDTIEEEKGLDKGSKRHIKLKS